MGRYKPISLATPYAYLYLEQYFCVKRMASSAAHFPPSRELNVPVGELCGDCEAPSGDGDDGSLPVERIVISCGGGW